MSNTTITDTADLTGDDELQAHYDSLPVNVSSGRFQTHEPRVSAAEVRVTLALIACGALGYASLRAVSYLQYGA